VFFSLITWHRRSSSEGKGNYLKNPHYITYYTSTLVKFFFSYLWYSLFLLGWIEVIHSNSISFLFIYFFLLVGTASWYDLANCSEMYGVGIGRLNVISCKWVPASQEYIVKYCHLLILLDDCGVPVNVFDLRFAVEDYW